jgi:hypothetical protein
VACVVLLASLWAHAGLALSAAAPMTVAEYIAGFVHYVRWQDESAVVAWSICIVGESPGAAERTYADASAHGKPLRMRTLTAAAQIGGCHVLDLTALDLAQARVYLVAARNRPILSVGRGADFCSAGGLVCLHPAGAARKFDINLTAVTESGLQVSSRLLTLGSARPMSAEPPR